MESTHPFSVSFAPCFQAVLCRSQLFFRMFLDKLFQICADRFIMKQKRRCFSPFLLSPSLRRAWIEIVFVKWSIVPGEVHDMHGGRLGNQLVVSAVLVVLIRDPVPVANVAVLFLGGLHCVLGLFFGQSVEGQAGTVCKGSNQPPRGEKLCVVRRNTSFWAVKPINCRFCIKKAG